nr:protein FAR1-related sequence 5-like [Tanacetum cinerariifolium]
MVESLMVQDHDMGESSMVQDHDMGNSSMVWDHDMGESLLFWDDQVDNQIVVLPEDLQHRGPTRAHRLKAALVGGYDKVLGDLAADTNFRKDLYKLVWYVYIGPDIFEQRWNDMISRFNLHDNKWLFDMNDTDKLSELLSIVQDLKKRLENEMQTPHVALNKDALYSDLLDVTVPDKVVIKTPKSIFRSKGTRRIKSTAEKVKLKKLQDLTGNACGEPGHHKGICKKLSNQDKGGGSGKNVVVDDEDEGNTDDQFDDEALGATEDKFDEDDEFDEEYESKEE